MSGAVMVVAILMAGMGLVAIVRPAAIWSPFGVSPTTPASRSEVRAVYGGYGVAIAALLVYAEHVPDAVRTGVLVAVAVSFFGMAAGRVISAVVEPRALLGAPGFFLLVELGLGALTLLAR
jgi:hypothetical protein